MKSKQRKGHKPRKVSNWMKACLPAEFRERSSTIQQYQQFFLQQTTDAVFPMVEVLNVNDQQLVLAVPSPALVNYLRLHVPQISAQLEELFHCRLDIKIVAQPESMEESDSSPKRPAIRHYPDSVCKQIQKSAVSLDDEHLREAVLSLAKTLKHD